MKQLVISLGAVTACLLVAADAKDDAVRQAKGRLRGTWETVSLERNGVALPFLGAAKQTLITVDNDKIIMTVADNTLRESTYTIDPTKQPAALNMVDLSGPNKGKAIAMIYNLDGDGLRICGWTANPGDERPTELMTKKGSPHALMTLKRKTQ